jgi:hypothetical protein
MGAVKARPYNLAPWDGWVGGWAISLVGRRQDDASDVYIEVLSVFKQRIVDTLWLLSAMVSHQPSAKAAVNAKS